MKKQQKIFNENRKKYSKEFTKELKTRFTVLEYETGIEDDVELKKQLMYNMIYGLILDVEEEMKGDKDIAVIEDAIRDYEVCGINDLRSRYFEYLNNTDTLLM